MNNVHQFLTSWSRAIRQSIKGIYRNVYVTIAATLSISIALMVLFISSASILIFREVVYNLQSQISLVAYLEKNTMDEAINELLTTIEKRPEVKSARIITPQEALNRLAKTLGEEGQVILSLDENPIPPSIEINLYFLEEAPKIMTLLKEVPIVTEILNIGEAISRLSNLLNLVRIIGGSIFILFTIFAMMLISLTVGLAIRNRKDEVLIMFLVGAPPNFIKRPFIMEGLLYGLLGGFLSIFVIVLLQNYFKAFMLEIFRLISPMYVISFNNWWYIQIMLIFIGAFIGATGSLIATQKYLKEA